MREFREREQRDRGTDKTIEFKIDQKTDGVRSVAKIGNENKSGLG
jgi:hypothetical protein